MCRVRVDFANRRGANLDNCVIIFTRLDESSLFRFIEAKVEDDIVGGNFWVLADVQKIQSKPNFAKEKEKNNGAVQFSWQHEKYKIHWFMKFARLFHYFLQSCGQLTNKSFPNFKIELTLCLLTTFCYINNNDRKDIY